MTRFNNRLNNVRVAAPCPANWDGMYGNERVRFCGECQLNVYNLSEMSKADAERLIVHAEGRLCVRYYQRKDGSIITQNCPVGLRALKQRVSRIATAITSVLLSFLAGAGIDSLASRFYLRRPIMMGDMATTGVMVPKEHTLPVPPPITPAPRPEDQLVMGKMVRISPKQLKSQQASR
jgi:hypothetical protein